ncbi:MAG TPA: YciI family protein [Solirubrobacterales bacterium]|nr:YciI family protein [Solirubrobacterales bacterium]
MRVMVLVKATDDSENDVLPSAEMLEAMGAYNEELMKAGIMLDGAGLKASRHGKRIEFSGKDRSVVDGPFAETKELLAGYWMWEVRDLDEAVEWARRCPNPMLEDSILEIRPVFEEEDFEGIS